MVFDEETPARIIEHLRSMILAGVSSSKTMTASTHARAISTSARSCSGITGRDGPLFARTDRSEFTATISTSPSARAAWR